MKLAEQEVDLDKVRSLSKHVKEEATEEAIQEAFRILESFETYREEVKASKKMRDALCFAQIRKSAMLLDEKKYVKAIRTLDDYIEKLANEISSIQTSHDMMAHAIASGRINV